MARLCRQLNAAHWLMYAFVPPKWAGLLLIGAPVVLALQHGDECVDKVTAAEAERMGAGQGELFAAQESVEFAVRMVMPWVYSELFARTLHSRFVGLPFVVAASLDLGTAQLLIPWAWRRIGDPKWEDRDGT